jgi:hypothetical protein
VPTHTCSMCGWTGPQHKMILWGGNPADWPNQLHWGPRRRHAKWACRDEAACQERQAQRKEKTSG